MTPHASPMQSRPTTVPSDDAVETTANLQLFDHLYTVLLPWIITRAGRLAEGDRDFRDDLIQIGLCTIWELCKSNVTTLHPTSVRAKVHRAMLHFRRAERRAGIIGPKPTRRRFRTARAVRYVPAHSTTLTPTVR